VLQAGPRGPGPGARPARSPVGLGAVLLRRGRLRGGRRLLRGRCGLLMLVLLLLLILVAFLFRFIFIKEFPFGVWNLAASKHTTK